MDPQPRLPLWFLLVNWALIAGAFLLGVQLGGNRVANLPTDQLTALAVVHREILQSHVDPQDPGALLENAIQGMVADLDPYSRYVPPAEVASYEEQNSGHYEGIGADFGTHGDQVVLHFPLAGGPAERAGLRPGDILLAVDGQPLDTPAQRERLVDLVRGPSGSEVTLRLLREGVPLEVTCARGDVRRPCLKWAHRVPGDDGLGYVYLADFHPGAAEQVFAAIDDLQRTGPLRGLVLDLRWNGGGSLDECVAIARGFLRSGLIVSQKRRGSVEVERHEATPEACKHPTLLLVLLVNDRSASASEVLAGALQDHGRAAIVGQRTHGKAYVNTIYTWKDLPFRLKLTTGKYQTPKGRDIERHHHKGSAADQDAGGIAPDVVAEAPPERRAMLQATLRASEPPAVHRDGWRRVAQQYGLPPAEPPTAAADPQLAQALATLRTRSAAPATPGDNR